MNPAILIATTTRWFPTVRLGMAFANAGCSVDAVCPSSHPLARTRAVRRMYKYSNFAPLSSLTNAISASQPDLIVPGDDLATHRLHELYEREAIRNGKQSQICLLLEHSLGAPESFPIVYERARFMQLAHDAGVRVPKTRPIASLEELRRWTDETGFPVVLKSDGSSGGEGVKVVQTVEDAHRSFCKLHAPPLLARAAKRAFVDGDTTLLWPSLLRRRPAVSGQTFIAGREANSTVACWKGSVLAALHFEVLNKTHSTGHATVLKLVEHPEMARAVETMVARLKLSGVHGFDFVLEANTRDAYLIEINPRSTQVGHLALGPGRDLASALIAAAAGTNVQPSQKLTDNQTIALFPQEWARDPASSFLQSAYHDVPWEEPELIRACIDRVRKRNRSLRKNDWDQAVAHLMRFAPQQPTAAPSSRVRPETE